MNHAPQEPNKLEFIDDAVDFLRCPSCHASDALDLAVDAIVCAACSKRYPRDIAHGTAELLSDSSKTAGKANIQAWWGDLYNQLYEC